MATKFTLADMERFGTEAWGELGHTIVEQWGHFNARYFASELRPVPLVIPSGQGKSPLMEELLSPAQA